MRGYGESAFPTIPLERVVVALRALADAQSGNALRAQLQSLATLLDAYPDGIDRQPTERGALVERLETALRNEEDEAIVRLARELARLDAERIPAADWTAMSNG